MSTGTVKAKSQPCIESITSYIARGGTITTLKPGKIKHSHTRNSYILIESIHHRFSTPESILLLKELRKQRKLDEQRA